ncbi:MAG: sugar ABC transporter ATP-binding protein [Verrucomicrobiota bacterium]
MPDLTTPLLRMRGIEKSFPGVHALRGVDLELQTGEVLALLGENGAGKSTLVKILAGAHLPDGGVIEMDGQEMAIASPVEAQRGGIAVIYQEFNLIPALTVRENILLGRERNPAGFIRRQEESLAAKELFDRIGVGIDFDVPCGQLSVGQQQLVEIAKALSLKARIIVMDEPTASLTPPEVSRLFAIIRDLKTQHGIIYISHRLDEIFEIADRVTVLRDGLHVATRPIDEVSREELIELMVGRQIEQEFPKQRAIIGAERLVVKNLCRASDVRNVSFCVRGGEVLGLTGLVGAGRTETARLIFGADRPDSGTIELDGKRLDIHNPRDAIRAGIGLLPEDRKSQGLVLGRSVRENFGLPNLSRNSRWGFVLKDQERDAFALHVTGLDIRIPHQEQLAKNLSGGNQQKIVLAKWLERNCEVLIFDEPTRGIDVGAKHEVYLLINRLAAQGKAILMISSEMPEVLGMSDRILVMRDGAIAGEIPDARAATQQAIMKLAVG